MARPNKVVQHGRLTATARRPQRVNGERRPVDRAQLGDYVLEDQIGYLLRVASQRHTVIFMARMVEGLTRTQFAVVAKLLSIGTCSQNHLGRLIALDAATVKGVVDRLRSRGFIETLPDAVDRRRHVVSLSARGRRVAERAVARALEITSETLAPLNIDERQQLAALLRRIC